MDHHTHTHDFINQHTAFGILILILGCFFAGYFVGKNSRIEKTSTTAPSVIISNQ